MVRRVDCATRSISPFAIPAPTEISGALYDSIGREICLESRVFQPFFFLAGPSVRKAAVSLIGVIDHRVVFLFGGKYSSANYDEITSTFGRFGGMQKERGEACSLTAHFFSHSFIS